MIIPGMSEETEAPGSFDPLSSGHPGGLWRPIWASISMQSGLSSMGWQDQARGGTVPSGTLQLHLDSVGHELVSVC